MTESSDVLYNPEKLGQKATRLAARQEVTHSPKRYHSIGPELNNAQSVLSETYRNIARSVKRKHEITPAGEWLIDNFYIIQEQIVQVREDLPPSYYRKLPVLASGKFKGYPRIYELTRHLLNNTDNIVNPEMVQYFVRRFQDEQELTLGELWGIPIIIRLALIQHLKERAVRILSDRQVRDRAEEWLDKVSSEYSGEPGEVVSRLSNLFSKKTKRSYRLMVTLASLMQSRGVLTHAEQEWFEYRLEGGEVNLEKVLQEESQRQAQLQVSVKNAVISLKEAAETDWSEFVENCSLVERTLRLDPAGVYEKMDFKTRDDYRKRIEQLAARTGNSELEVAKAVLAYSEKTGDHGEPLPRHVGFFLVGDGLGEFKNSLGYRPPPRERLRGMLTGTPRIYLGFIGLLTLLLLGVIVQFLPLDQIGAGALLLTAAVSIFPALELANSLANRILTLVILPRKLQKMAFKKGIPAEHRTFVVVPTMITSAENAREQLEELEVRYLANSDPSLRYALLTDFTDAPEKIMPGDEETLAAALEGIEELNDRYAGSNGDRFLLLHRERLWNESEQCWMGWERKRGKLEELNRLLMDTNHETTFTHIKGDLNQVTGEKRVRYVITLDADTKLPPGSARDLVRTAAHPLNRPTIDSDRRMVTNGYAILQPRISITSESAHKTLFSRIFSGNVGIDPYTTAVSDIYQDLFGEGVYTGKGIYDLEAFYRVLDNRFRENSVLSHDLLESSYLRTGLVTDIELFDDFPATYAAYSKRNHRWIRGDWQILYWLFPRVPGPEGKQRNPISLLSRWKIFDNLRRSLNPFCLMLLLMTGWTLLPVSPLIWTLAVVGILAFPIYINFSTDLFARPTRVAWKLYAEKIRINLKINTWQAISMLALLPHQAYLSMDAIIRTLWRMWVTRKRLLEWTTASQVARQETNHVLSNIKMMWIAPVFGIVIAIWVSVYGKMAIATSAPFLLLWIASPWLTTISGRVHRKDHRRELNPEQQHTLRSYACRTWQFFERYVNEEHSWLPPDNFQEEPLSQPAARTSPTNVGLSLLATQVARDFGYLTHSEWIFRVENTLNSLIMLERYRGHYFNWYSTKLGEVLSPRYVSTVDSGNLAASLLTLKQALLELPDTTWPDPRFFKGLQDHIEVLKELVAEIESKAGERWNSQELQECVEALEMRLPEEAPESIVDFYRVLRELKQPADRIAGQDLYFLRNEVGDLEMELYHHWLNRPAALVQAMKNEMETVLPSLETPDLTGGQLKSARLGDLIRQAETGTPEMPLESEIVKGWVTRTRELAGTCDRLVTEMDFRFLYNEHRSMFYIGYNTERAQLDKSLYDLLASEARLASFIAIAKGDVPPEHWFKLGRKLTAIRKNEILLSWGGSMFEYLMPLLFMRSYPETLLSESYRRVVEWQKHYGKEKGLPWGYSESAYFVLNMDLHYQYRSFGVPGLGLKRGLAEEYVVAPYAAMLALMVEPLESYRNLERLTEQGVYGKLGFYESVDYTGSRLPEEQNPGVVRSYMAHHQGMSLVAMANLLEGNRFQERFHRDPLNQSCELLLQERIPRGIPIREPHPIDLDLEPGEESTPSRHRVEHLSGELLDLTRPRIQMLSNGSYSLFLTQNGTGRSSYEELALTRWTGNLVEDNEGFYFYVRDQDSEEYWSVTHQPVQRTADRYDVWYHTDKLQMARVDNWIESFMEVCVSPEDNIELRRITLTNYSDRVRHLELTSYAEVVLNEPEADEAHPAFSKLFLQTEYLHEHHSLLAYRRPREEGERKRWMVHTVASQDIDNLVEPLQYETDRTQFIGRGRSLKAPRAMDPGSKLSRAAGNVSDPILSLRRTITLQPGEKKQITFGLGYADNREEAVRLADTYDNPYISERVFELATIYGAVELEHLDISVKNVHYFQKLAGLILYQDSAIRGDEEILKMNRKQQGGLWPYGISGDLPLVVFIIREEDQLKGVRTLIKAHTYWRFKGFKTDLLIINDHPPSYSDKVQEAIEKAFETSGQRQQRGRSGGMYVIRGKDLTVKDRHLIYTVAHALFEEKLPAIEFKATDQEIDPAPDRVEVFSPLIPDETGRDKATSRPDISYKEKANGNFDNGYGQFSEAGDEYLIRVDYNHTRDTYRYPPAPWINVIANERFGFLASERGSGYTWSLNSRENRLTGWSNDEVRDPATEAIYLRDEKKGIFWSPTPGPVGGASAYRVRHGFGYTEYESEVAGLQQEVRMYLPLKDPVKIIRVTINNIGEMARELTVFRYQELVMGVLRNRSNRYILTSFDADKRAILAINHYNNEFAGRVAFATAIAPAGIGQEEIGYSADRLSFIGRNNDLRNPAVVRSGEPLDQAVGVGIPSCAAFSVPVCLEPGETADLYFLLGEAENRADAQQLLETYRDPDFLDQAFGEVRSFWYRKLNRFNFSTPSPKFDLMMNGWLQYQNLACRIWGRSAFYQSGGAFGFRDQLQDSAAAYYLDPDFTRNQILLHAAHQFREGDVLHWWHPPTDRGIRSRITDDLLWLAYVTAFYLRASGDDQILDEDISYLEARELRKDEHEAYLEPDKTTVTDTLYEHCCRAIDRSLTRGAHGLPLMGGGDWNDGMDRVGIEGRGESVWLGFFLYHILNSFIPICEKRSDDERVNSYRNYRDKLRENLNEQGWDGSWYLRAFYDDGTPLGSSKNKECRIDAISQAWAVISGIIPDDRVGPVIHALESLLISDSEGIIRLLTPPFDKTDKNPGYIKGYIPGIRENGGQYTHAALWVIKAYARLGYGTRAVELMNSISPISHSETITAAQRYKVEPYVAAADIYGEPPLTGMGGWTWYTGSAGWMYRVTLESILGFQFLGKNRLQIDPVISADWERFRVVYLPDETGTAYHFEVQNPDGIERGIASLRLDGEDIPLNKGKAVIRIEEDGNHHLVELRLGLVKKGQKKTGLPEM